MAIELAIALATLLVENKHLVTLHQGAYHLTLHLCALYDGGSYGDVTIVVYQQYILKLYSLSCLHVIHVVNKQLLACLSLELLTVNLYDCVHLINIVKTGFDRRAEPARDPLFLASTA